MIKQLFLEKIITFPGSVGSAGDTQTLFLAIVEDTDRVGGGGGLVAEVQLNFLDAAELTLVFSCVSDPDPH